MSRRVAVIGAGSWGTCFASVCARNNPTTLWVRPAEAAVAHEINTGHTNSSYLAGAMLPSGLVATTDMADAVAGVDCVVVAIPSRWIRAVLRDLRGHVAPGVPIVSLVKGLEAGSNLRMTEVVADEIPADDIEKERLSLLEITKAEGKPEQAWDKIVTGRLNAWKGERALLEQGLHGDKTAVKDSLGGGNIARFVQVVIGS